jgi:hypothetical protein
MKSVVLLALVAIPASLAHAECTPDASLAIHLVASNEYLECSDLCPSEMSCLDVDCDLSLAELEASGGYGYVAFAAYNVTDVSCIEFFVRGWPIGPGTPDFVGPVYCAGENPLVLGEPFEKRGGEGGVVGFGECERPCTHMFCICMIAFGPDVYDWLPITVQYGPSSYSYPTDPHNWYVDCVWPECEIYYEHYAVIGSECEPIPNCLPGPTRTDQATWGTIKSLYR